jgi:hypothetical protein
MVKIIIAAKIVFRALWFCLAITLTGHTQSKSDDNVSLKPLLFFVGSWHCEGKFTESGKVITANLLFEPILNGKFLLFRHDDEPPFHYHAWSEWGWDSNANQFVSTIQDATGGIRVFRSSGWTDRTIRWSGGTLPDTSDQQFVFERLDNDSFRVSYSYRKNDSWKSVDSSLCNRVETKKVSSLRLTP